jgi:hypothetical protein
MKQAILGIGIMLFGLLGMGLVSSTPVSAACNERFLTFPAWYRGINDKSNECNITMPSGKDGLAKFIWTIVLNIVEIMIQVVAYISIGYIMWGGYTYMRSMGSPENIKRAKDMIQNAIIGLVLSIVAVIAVSFVIGRIATV